MRFASLSFYCVVIRSFIYSCIHILFLFSFTPIVVLFNFFLSVKGSQRQRKQPLSKNQLFTAEDEAKKIKKIEFQNQYQIQFVWQYFFGNLWGLDNEKKHKNKKSMKNRWVESFESTSDTQGMCLQGPEAMIWKKWYRK